MPVSKTTPGRLGARVYRAQPCCLPSPELTVGTQDEGTFAGHFQMAGLCAPLSTLRPIPSRVLAHDAGRCGSLLFIVMTCTIYSLPVSRRTPVAPNPGHVTARQ